MMAARCLSRQCAGLLARLLLSRDANCQPRLSVLRCEGRLVASHFGLQCGPMLHYWFPVYDNQFSAYSPGRILYRHILWRLRRTALPALIGGGRLLGKRGLRQRRAPVFQGPSRQWVTWPNPVLGTTPELALLRLIRHGHLRVARPIRQGDIGQAAQGAMPMAKCLKESRSCNGSVPVPVMGIGVVKMNTAQARIK